MAASSNGKRLVIFGALIIFALFLAGLVSGAVGAGFTQSPEDKAAGKTATGLLPKPHVHLPPQVVFPTGSRNEYLHYLDVHEKERKYGAESLDHHEEEIVKGGPFPNNKFIVTNTMLSAWLASLVLLAIFLFGVRRAKLIPGRLQSICELVIEALLAFVEGVVGQARARMLFPVICTIFLFVFINAWLGLIPIYQSLGFIDHNELQIHLLRPTGTDLNMPLALAIVSFIFVEALGVKLLGLHYFGKFFRFKSLKDSAKAITKGKPIEAFQGILDFFFVGPLEAFSEIVRLISFTFRLFGNMTAGEILVLMSAFLVPFVATLGVYGLELLVGFIQALIFAGLTLVFAAIAITPHEGEHD